MKKVGLVSLFSFIFLCISSTVAYLLKFVNNNAPVIYAIAGVLLLVISGIFAIFAKKDKFFNIACSAISAFALGFLIKAWYILRGFNNPLWVMLLVSLAAVAYLWLFFLLTKIPCFKRRVGLFAVLFVIISFIAYLAVVFTTKTTYVSTFGYYMIVELAFIFAMCKSSTEPSDLIRALTVSTYSVFAVAVIVIVMIVLDGDFDLDLDIFGSSDDDSSDLLANLDPSVTPDSKAKKQKK